MDARRGYRDIGLLLILSVCLAFCAALERTASGATRRALLVGIDRYIAVNRSADRATPLKGAVNDAAGMKSVLVANFGFKEADVITLPDEQATREGILQTLREHLLNAAAPGDLSLFFFAGHGSWYKNEKTAERDGKSETLVPADANRAIPDISDTQLARLFDSILAKDVQLIALFDSCHSGSVSRGLPGGARIRHAAPAAIGEVALAKPERDAMERGALIMSAAYSQETAAERALGPQGTIQGVFTYALLQALRHPDAQHEPVERTFQRLSALMAANGSTQQPVLRATPARAAKTFLAGEPRGKDGRIVVAVSLVNGATVTLEGGLALGLQPGARLSRASIGPAIELTLRSVTGMARSEGIVTRGSAQDVKPGEMFVIEHYGTPQANALSVFIQRGLSGAELAQLALQLALLRRDASLWVSDPTVGAPPTHVLSLDETGWVLADRAGVPVARLPRTLRAKDVRAALRSVRATRLFVQLPFPTDAAVPLPADAGARSPLRVVNDPKEADYLLVGRFDGSGVGYAWVMPGARDDGPWVPFALPPRSAWVPLRSDAGFGEELAKRAWRLNKVKNWLTLTSPLLVDPQFPYRLVLRRSSDDKLLGVNEAIRVGETWIPQLITDAPSANLAQRYYYLFSIDREGRGSLLHPPPTDTGENRLPEPRQTGGAPKNVVPIGGGIVAEADGAFGTETLILVASATPISPAEAVFNFDGVRSTAGRPADPLSALLFDIGEDRRGGSSPSAPVDWSIQRIFLRSVKQ